MEHDIQSASVLPDAETLITSRTTLVDKLPEQGLGDERALDHISKDITPALNSNSRSSRYYGFVTGGATVAAKKADNIVTEYDQNVQVHLPNETIATEVEVKALDLLCQLLDFDQAEWTHRTFTTGATASNVLGLASGRQYVLEKASLRNHNGVLSMKLIHEANTAQIGLAKAMKNALVDDILVLTTTPHSSLAKAASILGLGRDAIKLVGRTSQPHKFDMEVLEVYMSNPKNACIVAVSCAEVNTGDFATDGEDMIHIRYLCDRYGGWIHVDGAFGLMVRLLKHSEQPEDFANIIEGCENIDLADSITGDAHKLLNVPYDCGFFLSKQIRIGHEVFQNQGAAYLSASAINDSDISPLHLGIENSRRFRALPVYASLLALGRSGYLDMLERQVTLARRIFIFLYHHEGYEVLPRAQLDPTEAAQNIYMIVLFRAKDPELNESLVQIIKDTGKMYLSGTAWEGEPAARFAISNWQVNVEKDFELVSNILDEVFQAHKQPILAKMKLASTTGKA